MRKAVVHALVLVSSSVVGVALAGDLEPSGPPAPTPKPLSEIEPRTAISSLPFTISASGSYYLTQTLIGTPGVDGITIDADDVTLDLNGFALISGGGGGFGIDGKDTRKNLTIRNGTVSGWGSAGVWLLSDNNSIVSDMRAEGNGIGFLVGRHSRIIDSIAQGNGTDGFQINSGSVVTGCISDENGTGFRVNGGTVTLSNVTARENTGDGFFIGSGSTLDGCTAASNGGNGVTGANGSIVRGCSISFSAGDGINLGANGAGKIIDNALNQNSDDGIEVSSACLVEGNVIRASGQAGIHATGLRNRIDSNHMFGGLRGVDVDDADNIIVRNSVISAGTGYDIVAGNAVGTIVATPAGSGAWDNVDF